MDNIPVVKRGDVVDAELFNRLARAAMRAGNLRVGRGLVARIEHGGIALSIAFDAFRNLSGWMEARISAVTGGAGPDVGGAFTYDVIVADRADLPEYTGLTPVCGRPVRSSDTTTEIYPCAEGDPCMLRLKRNGDNTTTAELWVGTETLAFGDCGDGGAISEPNDLALATILDHILVDADGDPIVDASGNLIGDAWINSAQSAEFLEPVITDADGRIVVDADGSVVLDASASDACIALWGAVLVDAEGDVVVDANRNIVTEEVEV